MTASANDIQASKTKKQEHAEAEVESFQHDLGPFVVAAETTRMAMLFTDAKAPDHPIIFANDSFLKLTRYQRDDVLGKAFDAFLIAGTDSATRAQVGDAFDGKSDLDPEVRFRREDGSEVCVSIFINPVRDEQGEVVQHFVSSSI